jgi:hypothetical protein
MSTTKKVYKRISARSKLLLTKEEGYDVDFKKNGDCKPEDLVAFANSQGGGTILLGVDEMVGFNGLQKGIIVGCGVSDGDKLSILNKATQCIPHIDIQIITENLNDKPFLRVEIPSSPKKPHCTQKGVYKTRSDRQNTAILPQELLRIYLDSESENFLQRYSKATVEMRNELNQLHHRQLSELQMSTMDTEVNIETAVQTINDLMSELLEHVENSVGMVGDMVNELQSDTEMLKDDVELNHEINHRLKSIDDNTIHVAWKLNAILEHLNIEDPEITVARDNMKVLLGSVKKVFNGFMRGKKLKKEEVAKFLQETYEGASSIIRENYTVDDLVDWYEAIELQVARVRD